MEYPTLVHRWFDQVWNEPDREKNAQAIREMLNEDTLHHGLQGPDGGAVRGYEQFEAFHGLFKQAFPDIRIDLEEVVTDGDRIAARYTATATHDGPMPNLLAAAQTGGPPSMLEPTGKKTLFHGGGICTVKDGKFIEVWNQVDFLKLHYDLSPDTPDLE